MKKTAIVLLAILTDKTLLPESNVADLTMSNTPANEA